PYRRSTRRQHSPTECDGPPPPSGLTGSHPHLARPALIRVRSGSPTPTGKRSPSPEDAPGDVDDPVADTSYLAPTAPRPCNTYWRQRGPLWAAGGVSYPTKKQPANRERGPQA